METQINKLNFTGENIYAGIDVHKKSWTVTLETDEIALKTFNQPPDPSKLTNYLHRNFPGANYKCGYEAGFCGFWIYDYFKEHGIDCIVANPADVPTKDKEKKQKRDPIDSRKIARSLRNGELEGIHVHDQEDREARGLVRCCKKLVRDLTRYKCRIKSLLLFHGINYSEEFEKSSTHWSKCFIEWLESIELKTNEGTYTLRTYIEQAKFTNEQVKKVRKEIAKLSKSEKYVKQMEWLRSVCGIGPSAAMIYVTELGDINRFHGLDKLCSYVGVVPNSSSSGPNERIGEMTNRGNSLLKEITVECSWVAIRQDPALLMKYKQSCKKMDANKAIIKTAKRLLNRIRYVLKNQTTYVKGVVS